MESMRKAIIRLSELDEIFQGSNDPYRAHEEARMLLTTWSHDPAFFPTVMAQHLLAAETYTHPRKAPAVEFVVETNPYYTLVINCWIPRDDRDTQLSHQSVHHHGTLLLSTVALSGPGYETWNFTKPEPIRDKKLLFNMSVTHAGRHTVGNLLFVDAFIPHIVYYPERLSITLCLWSYRTPVTWKNKVMKARLLQRYKKPLRSAFRCTGLDRLLGMNVISLMDYYPDEGAFKGLLNRVTFPMGTNPNFLRSLFHIVQDTGHADMVEVVEDTVKHHKDRIPNAALVQDYCLQMRAGVIIEPQFEEAHKFLRYATLRRGDVRDALASTSGLA